MATPSTREAFGPCLAQLPTDAVVVCANGFMSRELFDLDDRPQSFYMVGSMGLGAAIGFGVATARPDRTVCVFDGDGNTLMGLGGLALVGALKPTNLYHVCFDNGVYASTGNQPTLAPHLDLERVAEATGYRTALKASSLEELAAVLPDLFGAPGPSFLRVMTALEPHPREHLPRVTHTPEAIRDRFMEALR